MRIAAEMGDPRGMGRSFAWTFLCDHCKLVQVLTDPDFDRAVLRDPTLRPGRQPPRRLISIGNA